MPINQNVNLPASGAAGAVPPPDFPLETGQPLQADAGTIVRADGTAMRPIDLARQNERTLEPLTYGQTDQKAAEIADLERRLATLRGEAGVEARHDVALPKPVQAAPNNGDWSHAPAASATDSPSRGAPGTAPRPVGRSKDPLAITGGFGSEGEYFPLDGSELKELVAAMLEDLANRIQSDLRFSPAITYPRLTAQLTLTVQAEADDQGFVIDKIETHAKTPQEIAERFGDTVMFVLMQRRREFDDRDVAETSPDELREQLGLSTPRKMRRGNMLSDVGW